MPPGCHTVNIASVQISLPLGAGFRMLRPSASAHIPVRLLFAFVVAALLLLVETPRDFNGAHQPVVDPHELRSPPGAAAPPLGFGHPAPENSAPGDPSKLTPLEAHLFQLLNDERLRHGLSALQLDPRLVALARFRSNDMVAREYFGHVMPDGKMVFSLMDKEKIPYRLAGENLARNASPPDESPGVAHQGFMNSPKHRENELEPSFTRAGVGAAVASNGTNYFTELFTAW